MKAFARLSWVGSGLGLILLTASPSFADVTGSLYLGGDGSVIVSPTQIQFPENSINTSGTPSSTAVSGATTLTYDGGTSLVAGAPVDINGGAPILASSTTPVAEGGGSYAYTFSTPVPVTFPTVPSLTAEITQFGPGSSNTNCSAATTSGSTCSPSLGGGLVSPIILENDGPNTVVATLPIVGTITDGTTVSPYTGDFTSTISYPGATPASVAANINTVSYAGSLTTSVSSVPEPRATSFVVFAGLLMGAMILKRRKKSVA